MFAPGHWRALPCQPYLQHVSVGWLGGGWMGLGLTSPVEVSHLAPLALS